MNKNKIGFGLSIIGIIVLLIGIGLELSEWKGDTDWLSIAGGLLAFIGIFLGITVKKVRASHNQKGGIERKTDFLASLRIRTSLKCRC